MRRSVRRKELITARVQHAGRVRRIADHDQIGIRRQQIEVEPETGRRRQDQPLRLVSSCRERRLGFGELRVDDQRPFRTKGASQQSEGFRASGSRQHLIDCDVVGLSNGLGCCVGVGVRRKVLSGAVDDCAEPIRGSGEADVDRKIDQAFCNVGVSVVVKIGNGRAGRARRRALCRAAAAA